MRLAIPAYAASCCYFYSVYHSMGPFYQTRVIIDSEINYNSDPLKIDFNFRSIISLRFMKRLIVERKLKLISINYKVIIDFEKLQLILKSYNWFGRKLWLISILGLLIKRTYDWL